MKLRRKEDIEVLKSQEFDLGEMMVWTKDLFLGAGTENFRIPEDILEFGFELIFQNYAEAKNDSIKKLIRRKVLHTREVVEAGIEILEAESENELDPYMAGAVTFAHDFGRFPQAQLGSYSDIKTGFDHAKAGEEILLAGNFPLSEKRGIEIKKLAEAVRVHSALAYTGENIYGKFIRDADKLGLLDYFPYHIEEYEVSTGKVTPDAIKAFEEGRLVPKENINNRIDVFLCWLSWQYDLNFAATRKLFESGGMKAYMLGEIQRMDEDVWRKVITQETITS